MTAGINLIAIDVGHTHIHCARFVAGNISERWQYQTAEAATAAAGILAKAGGDAIALASVVPAAGPVLQQALCAGGASVSEISSASQTFIKDVYATMGADRIADAAGAWQHYGQSQAVIVVDVGTGTTLTAVRPDRSFAGGFITLGLSSTVESLRATMPHLPDARALLSLPAAGGTGSQFVLGKDTAQAISSGTLLGHFGLLAEWVDTARRLLNTPKATAVITGGWSEVVFKQTQIFDVCDPDLTLKGVYAIAAARQ